MTYKKCLPFICGLGTMLSRHIKSWNTILLTVGLMPLFLGCTAAIKLDDRLSEEMGRHFSQKASQRNFQVECGAGLKTYVYKGRPKGVTGSEVEATIPVGATFCALVDQVETAIKDRSGKSITVVLELERISFAYSFKGNALWAEEGRDFDAAYILIGLNAVAGARSREYTIMSQKERFDSTEGEDPRKYAVVNAVLEDVIMELYSKIYRDF